MSWSVVDVFDNALVLLDLSKGRYITNDTDEVIGVPPSGEAEVPIPEALPGLQCRRKEWLTKCGRWIYLLDFAWVAGCGRRINLLNCAIRGNNSASPE
jgi:hypothetical protein